MKVRIKSGECPSYLTVGKVYEVIEFDKWGFSISDDNGDNRTCLFKLCGHLCTGSWEIVDE